MQNDLRIAISFQMQHPSQLEMFKLAVERAVVSNIYYHAMYPNGDGDISRDAVLAENIAKLASDLTPNHRALRIERNFHYEAPWPSAQAELKQVWRAIKMMKPFLWRKVISNFTWNLFWGKLNRAAKSNSHFIFPQNDFFFHVSYVSSFSLQHIKHQRIK